MAETAQPQAKSAELQNSSAVSLSISLCEHVFIDYLSHLGRHNWEYGRKMSGGYLFCVD